jgi:hypothetical protein
MSHHVVLQRIARIVVLSRDPVPSSQIIAALYGKRASSILDTTTTSIACASLFYAPSFFA